MTPLSRFATAPPRGEHLGARSSPLGGGGPKGRRGGRTLIAALAAVCCLAAAADPTERLADPGQEARARAMFREVRCLVCQNESIDDSQAELAHDLRQIVRGQVAQGRSDAQIRAFLVARYGEFVLLKPPFSPGNAMLWLTPLVVLLAGGGLMVVLLRRRAPTSEPDDLSEDEARRLQGLLNDK